MTVRTYAYAAALLLAAASAGCASNAADDEDNATTEQADSGVRSEDGSSDDRVSDPSTDDGAGPGDGAADGAADDAGNDPSGTGVAEHGCVERPLVESGGGAGGPGPCANDPDCTEQHPLLKRCHIPTKECLRCKEHADCADDSRGGELCDYDEVRGKARCVACLADGDCTHGPNDTGKCDRRSGLCWRCEEDADCQGTGFGERCRGGHCVACSEDGDCTKGVEATGKCFGGGAAVAGSAHRYTCTRCEDDDDCQGTELGKRCDRLTNRCVACLENSDCTSGPANTGKCHREGDGPSCTGCATHDECSAAFPATEEAAFPATEETEWYCKGVADQRTCNDLDHDYQFYLPTVRADACTAASEHCKRVDDQLACPCPVFVDPIKDFRLNVAAQREDAWNELGCDAIQQCDRVCVK